MKKIFMTSILAIFTFGISFSQTTWSEYNYASKGYKDVIEKGTDPKDGYRVRDIQSNTVSYGKDYAKTWLKSLTKSSTGQIVAYIVVYQLSDKANNQQYMCIPHPNSDKEMLNSYLNSIKTVIDNKTEVKFLSMLYTISMGVKW